MSLPPPAANQAYCNVSALEAGTAQLVLDFFITGATPGAIERGPSLSFLIQHSSTNEKMVFDLGIRQDWEIFPEEVKEILALEVPQDAAESLAKGDLSPADIPTVCLSHVHFDHVGDVRLFPESTFLVGEGTKDINTPGHSSVSILPDLPIERTKYISPTEWPALGPFPHALDYYGDGSLYIVDAPGHLDGHLNILARNSPDGAWIYLASDSAHHWDLITGKGSVAIHSKFGCIHADKEAAEGHILRIRKLWEMPRVRVLLAHDVPWYEANKGGSAFWPGKIPPE